MGAVQIAEIRSALMELVNAHEQDRPGAARLCASLNLSDHQDQWIQLLLGTLNFRYPNEENPLEFLKRCGIPAVSELTIDEFRPKCYVTLNYAPCPIEDLARFVDQLLTAIYELPESYRLTVKQEYLIGAAYSSDQREWYLAMSRRWAGPIAIEKWNALFPAELETVELACWDGAFWVPRLGLIAGVSLYDKQTYRGQRAYLIIVTPDGVDNFEDVVARIAGVIAHFKRDRYAAEKALDQSVGETLGLPEVATDGSVFIATREDIERRKLALSFSFERFPAVEERMKEIYGLRLPRHIAVWDALWRSASPAERKALEFFHLGRTPAGIMIWFEEGGLDLKTIDGLDPRLQHRFFRDPPEFVTAMWGGSDGLHYGLWYDDPDELPSFVALNYARDSAETWAGEATIIRQLTKEVRGQIERPDYPEEPEYAWAYAPYAALRWFRAADEEALSGEPRRWAEAERGSIVGGIGPALPPGSGNPRADDAAVAERSAAYKARSARIDDWISEAKLELRGGKPAFALALGRELHWLVDERYQEDCLELLCGAYDASGRHALADVTRVHHKHRDLKRVTVYRRPDET